MVIWMCTVHGGVCVSPLPFLHHCKNNKNSYVELKNKKNEKTFLKVEKLAFIGLECES